jgi:hypothetical protein
MLTETLMQHSNLSLLQVEEPFIEYLFLQHLSIPVQVDSMAQGETFFFQLVGVQLTLQTPYMYNSYCGGSKCDQLHPYYTRENWPTFLLFIVIFTSENKKIQQCRQLLYILHLRKLYNMATSTNDHDDLLDSDNDELEEEVIRDKVTKESFLQLIEKASEGGDLLKVINLLPNSSQRYGHSITMNAIVKNAALSQIDLLTRRLSENSDRLTNTTEKAMVRLFSPSPTFTDVSASVSNETSSYVAGKERKVDSERK